METKIKGLPVVNLNGATAQSLIDARVEACEALDSAMKAFSECSPHGRDYQTAAKGEYEAAQRIYADRFKFLDQMRNELMDEALAIQDQ